MQRDTGQPCLFPDISRTPLSCRVSSIQVHVGYKLLKCFFDAQVYICIHRLSRNFIIKLHCIFQRPCFSTEISISHIIFFNALSAFFYLLYSVDELDWFKFLNFTVADFPRYGFSLILFPLSGCKLFSSFLFTTCLCFHRFL